MSGHSISFEMVDDGSWLRLRVHCHETGPGRLCAVHYDHDWPDENTCRCEDPNCMCRSGDHGGCSEFDGHIEEVGPRCRAMPADECWYESVIEHVGGEGFVVAKGATIESPQLPVELSGYSWDEPVEVRPATQEVAE